MIGLSVADRPDDLKSPDFDGFGHLLGKRGNQAQQDKGNCVAAAAIGRRRLSSLNTFIATHYVANTIDKLLSVSASNCGGSLDPQLILFLPRKVAG